MKRILVPLDFSANSDISCVFSEEIAKVTGAEVILFHSFFEQTYFADGGIATGFESGITLNDDITLNLFNQKKEQLNRMAEQMIGRQDSTRGKPFKVTPIIETGNPHIQIFQAVDDFQPELIIMGSSGMGKEGFLSGSVSRKVMDNSEIPVMAVPEIPQFLGLKNVLYTTDLQHDDVNSLLHLIHLLKDFDINVHCLHLNVNGKNKNAEKDMKALGGVDELQQHLGRLNFNVLLCENPKETLTEFIADHNIHLIAFIPYKKNFFRIFSHQDIFKGDLFDTGLPILSII